MATVGELDKFVPVPIFEPPVAVVYHVSVVPLGQVPESVTLVPVQTFVLLTETAVGFLLSKTKGTTNVQVPSVTCA